MSRIEYRTQVPASAHRVWALVADPGQLPRLSPPRRHIEVEARHGGLAPGALVFLSFSFLLRRFRWASVVEHVEPPECLVETMHEGPLAVWRHEIRLRPTPWGTEIAESVEYRLRWGKLGSLVNGLIAGPALERLFEYRQSRLLAMLTSETPAVVNAPSEPLEAEDVPLSTVRN